MVIDPELDIWVWADSSHVAEQLGWKRRELMSWLERNHYIVPPSVKPRRPKEVLEAALVTKKQKPRSSSLYKTLAEKVSLTSCTDRAFLKLRATLQQWFGE